jgi:predicted glycogen debranching enzyme
VLLSKLDLRLFAGDDTYELDTNKFPGTVHPTGHKLIASFTDRPWPTWVYAAAGWQLQQEVLMVDGLNASITRWTLLEATGPMDLEIRPKVTSRDFHALLHRRDLPAPITRTGPRHLTIAYQDGRCGLTLGHGGTFTPQPDFYYSYLYDCEWERGFDFEEDLFCPGVIRVSLGPGESTAVVASTDEIPNTSIDSLIAQERSRREQEDSSLPGNHPAVAELARAARHFLVRTDRGWTVIAGYHWFGDWGRDTFISLPGLTLVTGRHELARSILADYARFLSGGLLPNRFPDLGEPPEYNSVDAALWFVYALAKYRDATQDAEFCGELFPVVQQILRHYEKGTSWGIRLDSDGLLTAGQPGTQLTWMDAKVDDRPVTPRLGKPVEIQALWHRALRFARRSATELGRGDLAEHYGHLMRQTETAFQAAFWNAGARCCHDVISPDGRPDSSIRPNQILVPYVGDALLPADKQRDVVDTVVRELLTPMGLRSLSPTDPNYKSRYQGDPRSRDLAYHQGTVWPWLLGPLISAFVKTRGGSLSARKQAEAWLDTLLHHMDRAGVGFISELADADGPHTPGGCIAQAWSVAEPLRALCEDLYPSPGARPTADS